MMANGGISPAAVTARAPLGPLPTATPSFGNGAEQLCSLLPDTMRRPTVRTIWPASRPAPPRLGIDRGEQHSGGREILRPPFLPSPLCIVFSCQISDLMSAPGRDV